MKFKVGDRVMPIGLNKNMGVGTIIKISYEGTFGKRPCKVHFDGYKYNPGDQHSFEESGLKLVNSYKIKERLGVK